MGLVQQHININQELVVVYCVSATLQERLAAAKAELEKIISEDSKQVGLGSGC